MEHKLFVKNVAQAIKKTIDQGCQSRMPIGGCLYSGPNNSRCPVGWMFSDEECRTFDEWEGDTGIRNLHREHALLGTAYEDISSDQLKILIRLQYCHDESSIDDKKFNNEFMRLLNQDPYQDPYQNSLMKEILSHVV